jgi:hypothetical protein
MKARATLVRLAAALGVSLALAAPAQAQFIPYFGKNKVKYDNFNWRVYKSPHFEIYYYPEFEQHLGRVSSYAESAYQKVSGELKHEITFPIPLILYKTHSEFEQTNLFPDFVPEGVLAFAEPVRDRMVLPIDEPYDKLQGLITHELTHIFEFDLIPRSVLSRNVPLWVDEGLADYMRATWDNLDLMTLRDAAVVDQVPRLSRLGNERDNTNPRLVYNLGHAAFEFIAARYGKEGIRQFLYTLRKNLLGGGAEDIYQQAFRVKPEEFDDAFDKWLKERFKPFRDKQRPSDYGRDLAPDQDKSSFTQVFSFAPSPTGELVAAISGNRADGEADVVLLSTKDRVVVRNLTKGYTGEFEGLSISNDFVAGRSLAFDPKGDTVAFFARTGKGRSLILVSALTGRIVRRLPVSLDQPSGPCLLPDGRHALFSALKEGIADIYGMDLETGEIKNLTNDPFADSDPQVSPDGALVVYNRRVSGYEKIYSFPLADPSKKTQLTFGAFDDMAPSFSSDGIRVYYASDENDDIFNVRSLDLITGVVRQYTDVLGGNMAPATLPGKAGDRVAFISYFKGEYRLHSIETGDPLSEPDAEVRASSEEIVDFQPDVTHQVLPQNKRKKRLFEKLYLEGRPPINVGVTSSGDFFGGTAVALTDVLGDQNFVATALSIREYRTYEGTYINLASRFHYGLSAYDTTRFFYSNYYVPQNYYSRDGAFLTQRLTGASLIGQYPLSKFRRLELSASAVRINEKYEDPSVTQAVIDAGGNPGAVLSNATFLPVNVGFVQETTRFREYGPLDGSTVAVNLEIAPGFGASRRGADIDARKYLRLGSSSAVFALRARAFHSEGDNPAIRYFGGNMELRGYGYSSFSGNTGFFANTELRFPVINAMATPIGILGPVRGTFFAGIGGAKYKGQVYDFWTKDAGVSYVKLDPNDPSTYFGEPVDGLHLVDGRASVGFGLQFFFLGYPLHFDFTKLTDLKVFSKTQFDFWIGFDF